MKFIDIAIIVLSVIAVAVVVYFAFIRRKEHCSGCPYKKQCKSAIGECEVKPVDDINKDEKPEEENKEKE